MSIKSGELYSNSKHPPNPLVVVAFVLSTFVLKVVYKVLRLCSHPEVEFHLSSGSKFFEAKTVIGSGNKIALGDSFFRSNPIE